MGFGTAVVMHREKQSTVSEFDPYEDWEGTASI